MKKIKIVIVFLVASIGQIVAQQTPAPKQAETISTLR